MEGFFGIVNDAIVAIDGFIWGPPLMVLILFGGILLTTRLRGVQFRHLPRGAALHGQERERAARAK